MSRRTAEHAHLHVDFPEAPAVDVHLFDLDQVAEPVDADLLVEERDRAARFHKPLDARRFLTRRTLLRRLLAERTGRDPRELGSTPDEFGRPCIPDIEPLRFNTSRTGSWFAVALHEGTNLPGVDIESSRHLPDAVSIGRRILSDEESGSLGADHAMSPEHLLRVWTRKEAVLKAIGRGLSIDPSAITIPVGPEDLVEPLCVPLSVDEARCDVWLCDPPAIRLPDGLFLSVALALRS